MQTEYGPAAVVVIALLLTSVAAAVTFAVATYQMARGKRDVARPVIENREESMPSLHPTAAGV
jgi:hypothetical protein